MIEEYEDDFEKRVGYTYGLASEQWDYCDIGGRWFDSLPLKDGSRDCIARVKDIDVEKIGRQGIYGMLIEKEDGPPDWLYVEGAFLYDLVTDLDPETMVAIGDIHI